MNRLYGLFVVLFLSEYAERSGNGNTNLNYNILKLAL